MSAYVAALVAEGLDTIPNRTVPTAEEEEDWLARARERRAFFLLAFEGPEVVGMLDLWAGDRRGTEHVARFGMSVAKRWRGKGLGRRLLEHTLRDAKQWPDLCRVELEVVHWNEPAIRLYKAMGFVVEAAKAKAINLRGEPEDLLLMALVW
jgi:RimJ/RimL family protein N-acetyltransferase